MGHLREVDGRPRRAVRRADQAPFAAETLWVEIPMVAVRWLTDQDTDRAGLLGKQAAVVSLRNDIDLTLSGTAARTNRRPSLPLLSHRVGLSKATLLRLQEMLAAQEED